MAVKVDGKPSLYFVYPVATAPDTYDAAECSVLPESRSSACGIRCKTDFNDASAPAGLPGRLSASELPMVPQSPRERAAKGVCFNPSARIISTTPSRRRSHTLAVASGVTSRVEIPVPPVVTTNRAWSSTLWFSSTDHLPDKRNCLNAF